MIIDIRPGTGIILRDTNTTTYVSFGLTPGIVEEQLVGKPSGVFNEDRELTYTYDTMGFNVSFNETKSLLSKLDDIEIRNDGCSSLYVGGQPIASGKRGILEQFGTLGLTFPNENDLGDKVNEVSYWCDDNKVMLFFQKDTGKLISVSLGN